MREVRGRKLKRRAAFFELMFLMIHIHYCQIRLTFMPGTE